MWYTALCDDKTYFILADDKNTHGSIAEVLRDTFENESVLKVSDDIKGTMLTLSKYGIDFETSYYDTGIGA